MTDLKELLANCKIRKAVIIDDVFDVVPRSDELNTEKWSSFFFDLDEHDKEFLRRIFPPFENTDSSKLKVSEEFITALWNRQSDFPNKATLNLIFQNYESKNNRDRKHLESLAKSLKDINLDCTTMGTDSESDLKDTDLVFIDLYLGFTQSEKDMADSIELVRKIVDRRRVNPPLVVLMSRSSKLEDKRKDFRDKAGLLGSAFRFVTKVDLQQEGVLEKLLTRLASHYEDAKRVAAFIQAWEKCLDKAKQEFIPMLRRLDLPELGQIQTLLLKAEGQKQGEYLLDVADRALQHQIEADPETIKAAQELNKINFDDKYPASHLEGTADLQKLVYQMMYLHEERLKLTELTDKNGKIQLQFGDLLRRKSLEEVEYSEKVSLVVTPACDLSRRGVERVMLLNGERKPLTPEDWSNEKNPLRTPIMILKKRHYWIEWNLKDVETLSWDDLGNLGKAKCLERIGRLREIYALEIQHKLLADFGRVGPPANLPVSFNVSVSVYYVDQAGKARKLEGVDFEYAACYAGPDSKKSKEHSLVLNEQDWGSIEKAVRKLTDNQIHKSSKGSHKALKDQSNFFIQLEQRVKISTQEGKHKQIKGEDGHLCLTTVRGGTLEVDNEVDTNLKKSALILKVTDIPADLKVMDTTD